MTKDLEGVKDRTTARSKKRGRSNRRGSRAAGQAETGLTPLTVPFCETVTARRIFEAARIAHVNCEFAVVIGDAGTGKTTAIHEYVRQYPDTILIEADSTHSASAFFAVLRHILYGAPWRGSLHALFEDTVDRLRSSGRLLIVDEPEDLTGRVIELIRRLHDKARIGMLFVGMPKLLALLRGEGGEHAQLHSRVGFMTRLKPLSDKDTEAIVKNVLPSSNGAWKHFHDRSRGNARRLSKLICRAIRLAEVNNCEVDAAVIDAAASLLMD
jgi:DNA transposition AAA+ family ATPase